MSLVLELSLEYLRPIELVNYLTVCKEITEFILSLSYNNPTYIKLLCDCGNKVLVFDKCKKCLKHLELISKTEIIKKFKLNDLSSFVKYEYKSPLYRKQITMYNKIDILDYLLVSNKFKPPLAVSKARQLRINKIKKLYKNVNPILYKDYIANGRGGLKQVDFNIARYKNNQN